MGIDRVFFIINQVRLGAFRIIRTDENVFEIA